MDWDTSVRGHGNLASIRIPTWSVTTAPLQDVEAAVAHSAKLAALRERLRDAAAASADLPRPIKSVVFSQFTGMLDAAGAALAADGVTCVRIDGSMTAAKRAAAIATFSEPGADAPTVALVSLKAGGVGLNLTVASQVPNRTPSGQYILFLGISCY